MEEEKITEVKLMPSKSKKPRTEAQMNATKRALEALQAKRKENWEKKKAEMLSKQEKAPEVKAPVEPKMEIKPIEPKSEPKSEPKAKRDASPEPPAWARKISALLERAEKPKKKRKVIIEESSESEEEEIIVKTRKRKVPDDVPPPPPVAHAAVITKPENPLRKMLYRN